MSYHDNKRGEVSLVSEKWISSIKFKDIPEALYLENVFGKEHQNTFIFAVADIPFSLTTPTSCTATDQGD